MCFSATASLIVGGGLTVTGVLTLRLAGNRSELLFAAIPLLFGIQQIIEGVIWLSLQHDAAQLKMVATYLYSVFSHVLWPVYVPLAVALMEPNAWRRKALWIFSIIGVVAAFHLLVLIATQSLTVVAGEHIIYVSARHYEWPMMQIYVTATCLAPLFSSYPLVRAFGAAALLLFFVSYLFYTAAFFSVWCFFAAILSAIIYLFFRSTPRAA
ncbi:MAG: hypothetical protein COY36_03385 [Zetaproteobacteria bacterium CG_4_10_14_0_2_um_filter_55_20]|nr:MAG: hypothetical protein COT53_10625 [Zetaproteobacteria bacterium CG08_land_8_20_14_0_20_55_17]PIY54310.1 MAG: hypothetical protein COZ01_00840 [Zetaproteobacteria bacterium CG_4_10_14_0_8_um_filter_55_43]PIZ39330.1 MAG: hypothetical protein COY36_03385 [Zetaproteobacteria bacterium CG_4_10_14_0_2_um_filter_55_20]